MSKVATDNLLNAIPREGGVIDLQPLFFRLALDVTTEFLFGESIESLKVPELTGEDTFAQAFNVAQEYVAKRFRLLDLYWLIDGKRFRDACKKVYYFADKIIDHNLAEDSLEGQGKYVFLRAMSEKTPDRTAPSNLVAVYISRWVSVLVKWKNRVRETEKDSPEAQVERIELTNNGTSNLGKSVIKRESLHRILVNLITSERVNQECLQSVV
ncbi:hypothetical protein IFR05_014689 [Cadophora sp. M221]|nr:hypothetical protein IFR05_014689 [Cadophora sp. M221]